MLNILGNGLKIVDGKLQYAWFEIEKDFERFYRCVALRELQVIPAAEREDYDLLGKQLVAIRGLHNAGVNFVYAAMGIYKPDHIGVVQYFGAAGEALTENEAASKALVGASTVEAVLSNFPQSRLGTPNEDWLQWYLDFITSRGKNIAAVLGHPDPREGKHNTATDGSTSDDTDADLAEEQNEILFRGLSKLQQNFVFQVLAEHISRPAVTKALIKIAETASNVASRRKGSLGVGFNLSIPIMAALTQGHSTGTAAGHGAAQSVQDGVSQGWGSSHTVGSSHSVGHTSTDGVSQSSGSSQGTSTGQSHTESQSTSSGSSHSSGGGVSHSQGWSGNVTVGIPGVASIGGGYSDVTSVSSFGSSGSFSSSSHGTADSTMNSQSQSVSQGQTMMHSESNSVVNSTSVADSQSQNAGVSHAVGSSVSQQQAQSAAETLGGGMSTGLMPGVSINRTWQLEDDVAERFADVLRRLESLANQASMEGGFMTNAFLFTDSPEGDSAGAALVPQAFHGADVPTPVLTIHPLDADEPELRAHAFSFTPWTETDDGDPFSGSLWTRYATLLTASQLAAYTAPGLFEEGSASTTMSVIPHGMGFYPAMPGDVVLGHQYSPETADLTNAQVRISPESLMHTMASGDTGFGKSVAMIRMAYETTLHWKTRTVVLDFGAGWRSLLNAPGLQGYVDILQLWPDAVRPLRWNPLQIGRNISPETQWRAFADVFGGIAQLGVKRQKQELLDALREVYVAAGVLVDDDSVRSHEQWGKVGTDEETVAGTKSGIPLADLNSKQRQALAVHRSSKVGLIDLYNRIKQKLSNVPSRDTMLSGVLEGIVFRLNPLVQGTAAKQFAPGFDTVPVEDLSRAKGWGITIIEGGMFLDDFGKAFLLGWTGWHLYMDMVARRVHEVNNEEPLLQIFYEEANKIFVKEQGSGDESSGGGVSASQRFADMFRDARKYKSRLHVITQAPHLIADDIISSCNNIIIGYLKNPKDKDLVLSALARSEKGFRDEEWRRFVDDIPIGMAIGRFPYTMQRTMQRPFLFKPLMLDTPEPSDVEIEQILGRIQL